ncbi:uncharacterized protein LOC121309932 isoform X2 [Polyodon spathula]|uniref:uncharacterized protein LOC121309932 isoform X2 n=1 Tax=Polyodon spathula TaxID=7913 RepID=UPI001B7F6027|nr:uncharacterized protein LOC121309932 isoform X2 [Polyodon spathula]
MNKGPGSRLAKQPSRAGLCQNSPSAKRVSQFEQELRLPFSDFINKLDRSINIGVSFSEEERDCTIDYTVKTALETVVHVIKKLDHARIQNLQAKAYEKEKENELLKMRLEATEKEMQAMRQYINGVHSNAAPVNAHLHATSGQSCNARRMISPDTVQIGASRHRSEAGPSKAGCAPQRECQYGFESVHGSRGLNYSSTPGNTCEKRLDTWTTSESVCGSEGTGPDNLKPALEPLCIKEELLLRDCSEIPSDVSQQVSVQRDEDSLFGDRYDVPAPKSADAQAEVPKFEPIQVKEESPEFDTVRISWEVSEESSFDVQKEAADSVSEQCREQLFDRVNPHMHGGPTGGCQASHRIPESFEPNLANIQRNEQPMSSTSNVLCRSLAAEKQRRYRERLKADPERAREHRAKDLTRPGCLPNGTEGCTLSDQDPAVSVGAQSQQQLYRQMLQQTGHYEEYKVKQARRNAAWRRREKTVEQKERERELGRIRYHERKVSIRDLPEQIQLEKRELWREASRRYRQKHRQKHSPQAPLPYSHPAS